MTKLFVQNTDLDFIPPLPPNTMLIPAITIFSSSTMTSTVNVIPLKSNIVKGGGAGGGLFKIEIYIEKSIVGTF